MSSHPSGSTIDDLRIGHGKGDSRGKPAAAARNDDPRRRPAELLDDFEARSPLSGNDRRIVEARHHGRTGFRRQCARRSPRGFPCAGRRRRSPRPRRACRRPSPAGASDGHHDDRRECRAAGRRSPRRAHDCPTKRRRRRARAPPARAEAAGWSLPCSLKAPPVCRHSHLSQMRVAVDLALDERRSLDEALDPLAQPRPHRSRLTSAALVNWLIFHPFD